jgi:hypothetical protein
MHKKYLGILLKMATLNLTPTHPGLVREQPRIQQFNDE